MNYRTEDLISKTKGELKIMRDDIVDEYVAHTMTIRNM